ncbi:MAG TPA: glycosyltransferase family 4 protein [Candidatus Dorea intestinavium]|nr:glycosyltransferase family 4 protein [Candidatus Dorea intestinavium]
MSSKEKIVIFTADSNGGYPVPAVKGGAVSTLIEHLVKTNEKKKIVDLTVVSFYDKFAKEKAEKEYPHVKFVWIKPIKVVKIFDKLIYIIITKLFKKNKSISFISLCSLSYFIVKASKYLKNNDIDKVVIENNIPMAWIIKLSKYEKEYYFHFHNVPRVNARCKKIFKNATGYLCVSNYVSRQIQLPENPIGPINREKIKVLYNCVDTTIFRKINDTTLLSKERKKFNIATDEKIVVFVGRLSEEKGITQLLESVSYIKKRNFKVLIVGSLIHNQKVMDTYQQKLYNMSKNLENKICFTGYIDQDELPLIYNIADVAVLPSMWDEPAGLTMVEAMSCGTPVVTTKSGGIPEYVGRFGVTLERDDKLVMNIAYCIKNIFDDNKSSIKKITEEGISHINDMFSTDTYLQKFVNYLNALIKYQR